MWLNYLFFVKFCTVPLQYHWRDSVSTLLFTYLFTYLLTLLNLLEPEIDMSIYVKMTDVLVFKPIHWSDRYGDRGTPCLLLSNLSLTLIDWLIDFDAQRYRKVQCENCVCGVGCKVQPPVLATPDLFYSATLCIARTLLSKDVCLTVRPSVCPSVTRRYAVQRRNS